MSGTMSSSRFPDLNAVAVHFRDEFENSAKKFILLFGYNGTGKTLLSAAFKDIGKNGAGRDTLYFNAFTEDLFSWDNDLENDRQRVLKLNSDSSFFDGLGELEMDVKIGKLLERYADFNFYIDYEGWEVIFFRARESNGDPIPIKVSRGEENVFIWCFFLAVVQLAMDAEVGTPYHWVEYVYIDDPISSLDEQNAIAVANHLVQMLKSDGNRLRAVISTHHTLFFNVLCNEFRNKAHKHHLKRTGASGYVLDDTSSRPFLHHLSTLVDLHEAQLSGALYPHHFTMMRRVMEQTANFFGIDDWSDCIRLDGDDPDRTLSKRMIDVMSHGDYSLFDAREMMEENKGHFRNVFRGFIAGYPFKSSLFPEQAVSVPSSTP
jgi:hypothetical protein